MGDFAKMDFYIFINLNMKNNPIPLIQGYKVELKIKNYKNAIYNMWGGKSGLKKTASNGRNQKKKC